LEQLAKVLPYGTLATTVPFYNISTLAIEIKNKEQIYNFSKSSKSRMNRFKELHATRKGRTAFWQPLV